MQTREFIGLILSIVAFVIAPFGYWLSASWYFVALALGAPGLILFFTARNIQKYDPTIAPNADIYPSSGSGLRGFHGARSSDNSLDNSDGD